MKISHKFILGYLFIAALAVFTTIASVGAFRGIENDFDHLVTDPLPTLKALGDLGQGAIRIVSSTSEYCFIYNEAALAGEEAPDDEEKELAEEGKKQYLEALRTYEPLAAAHGPVERQMLSEIKKAGAALIADSNDLIALKKSGAVGEQVLVKKEQFEEREKIILGLIEQAKAKEYDELLGQQRHVKETIASSTAATIIVTIAVFGLSFAVGSYLARRMARRIVALSEASQRVSGGDLDTPLEVAGRDELAALGRSFNEMVAELRDSHTNLTESKNFVDNIFSSMPDILTVLDRNGRVLRVNHGMSALTGYSEDELLALSCLTLNGDEELISAGHFAELKEKGLTCGIEKNCRTKTGELVPISLSISLLRNADRKAIGFVCAAQNISERKRLESKLTHQALHDPLTGLANRVLFQNRVEHALALAARNCQPLSVLFLDLDNFKKINDSLGHAAGDELLQEVAKRLEDCLRAYDTAARLGGDEFALLLEQLAQHDYAETVAARILDALRAPFHLAGKEIFIQSSIGIAHSIGGEGNPEELLRNADVAMYMSKNQGKGRYTVFEPDMHKDLIARIELEADLRRGIDNEEFRLFYQPIIEFKTGRVKGMEALLRWQHPARGMMPPLDFIPIAEETGLIVPLGRWVLGEACRQAVRWQREIPASQPLSITVNLSARQFQHPQIVEHVAAALDASGLAAGRLVLEITESMMLHNTETMIEQLGALKNLGVRLAIDDFGTGYSSLSYLHRFPIDIIKIDQTFIMKIEETYEDPAVARAIITMSESLHLTTIAEGIEKIEQSKLLQTMGCELGQGYYFAKPLAAADFAEFLVNSNAEPANGSPVQPNAVAPAKRINVETVQ